MKLIYYGHSAFMLQTNGTNILVDPFISGNPHTEGVITADQLNPDIILLTHAHGDHFGDTVDIARRSGALVVANAEIAQYLSERHEHGNVRGMNTGGSWSFDWGRVTMTDARHSSSFPDGTYGGNPNGFVVQAEGRTVYAMGDTSPFAEMAWIAEDFEIDLALIPIGDCYTMGPEMSVRAANLTKASRFVPIHFNTFPAIDVDVSAWEAFMAKAGHETLVLPPGEETEV